MWVCVVCREAIIRVVSGSYQSYPHYPKKNWGGGEEPSYNEAADGPMFHGTIRRMYELGGLSLVCCLTSVAVAVLFRAIAKPSDEAGDTTAAAPTPHGSGEPPLDPAGFGKYLKLIAVLLVVELFKEVCGEQEGHEQRTVLDRALRVLRLESFRESLRGLAQGRGLPPLPAAGNADGEEDNSHSAGVENAPIWLRHTHNGRAFYRRRGDDDSCTLTAPGGGVSVTEKPEVNLHALCKAEAWFEERWVRLADTTTATN